MKITKLNHLIILALVLVTSCKSDDDSCTDTIINTTSLEDEYGCTNTKNQVEIDLSENHTIIRNQLDYTDLVTGDCQPTIDFLLYDLVIGKKGLSTGNISIVYELTEDCETGNKNLTVTFNQDETTVAPNLTYHSLIPKLSDEQELDVEIIIN